MEPLLEKAGFLHRGGVQVAAADQPLIVLLEAEHPRRAGSASGRRGMSRDVGAATDLLVEPLERVR